MKKLALLILFILPFLAKAQSNSNDLKELLSRMQGSFSSEAQSKSDTDYYDIRLNMTKIWPTSTDENWLYVEQAMSTLQEKPYRQRIYKVTNNGASFESAVYLLPNPKKYVGGYSNALLFDDLSKDSLILKDGCSVFMVKFDDIFSGKTGDNSCPSDLRGASFARSKVTIYKDKLISWDQGFDKEGKQVWGAEKGGYVFDKIEQ